MAKQKLQFMAITRILPLLRRQREQICALITGLGGLSLVDMQATQQIQTSLINR